MEQHQSNIAPQYQYAGFSHAEVPLYGQGVMFFDQDNRVVRKADMFVFDPAHPANFDNQCEYSETEPKKLRYRMPDIAGNDAIMKMVEQANAAFHQNTSQTAEVVWETHTPNRLAQ